MFQIDFITEKLQLPRNNGVYYVEIFLQLCKAKKKENEMKTLVKVLLIIAAVVGLFEACSTSKRPEKSPCYPSTRLSVHGHLCHNRPGAGCRGDGNVGRHGAVFRRLRERRPAATKPLSDSTVLNAASASKTFIGSRSSETSKNRDSLTSTSRSTHTSRSMPRHLSRKSRHATS